jgi:hypothetical protein
VLTKTNNMNQSGMACIYRIRAAAGMGGAGASPAPGLRESARAVPTYTSRLQWGSVVDIIRAVAGIGSACGPGASPAPEPPGSRLYRARAAAGTGSTCGPGANPAPDLRESARDAPRVRKYRRAARLGCKLQWQWPANGWGSMAGTEFDSSNHGLC